MGAKRHRLARRRKTLGFTQEGLAEQLGVDPTTVRRWESGETETGPQPWLRPKLARCLQVSGEQLEELLGEQVDDGHVHASLPASVPQQSAKEHTSPSNRRVVLGYGFATAATTFLRAQEPFSLSTRVGTSWAKAIYEAVLNPMEAVRRMTASPGYGPREIHALRAVVDRAMQISLSSDYGALEQSLPALIGYAEAAAMQLGLPAAYQALSDVYAVVSWTLIKADNPLGAWIAAQRAIQAAEQVGDVLRIAAATRCLAEVHMRAHNLEEATRTAFLAAVQLESVPPEDRLIAVSLRGAALLSAAAASARRGDSREAHAALKAAAGCAAELGQDRSDLATVFGPTNVAIHQVAIAVELGDARAAVSHIPAVQLAQMPKPLTERRARFLIDVARSYARVRDDLAAIEALLQAETIAPDELRHHRLTHELVPQLLTRENRTSDLRALAAPCNLLNEEPTR